MKIFLEKEATNDITVEENYYAALFVEASKAKIDRPLSVLEPKMNEFNSISSFDLKKRNSYIMLNKMDYLLKHEVLMLYRQCYTVGETPHL